MIDLRDIKRNFALKFPNDVLTSFLLEAPEQVDEKTFLELVKVWLKIINKR
jgi:hypothetical protein